GELSRCEHLHVAGAYVPGAYAEFIKLPEENVIPIPDNVDYDTAAMVEPSAVVVHGFYRTSIHPGAKVAVMGCGILDYSLCNGRKFSVLKKYMPSILIQKNWKQPNRLVQMF